MVLTIIIYCQAGEGASGVHWNSRNTKIQKRERQLARTSQNFLKRNLVLYLIKDRRRIPFCPTIRQRWFDCEAQYLFYTLVSVRSITSAVIVCCFEM